MVYIVNRYTVDSGNDLLTSNDTLPISVWLGRSMHPQQHLVMAALWNRAGHYIFVLCFLLSIFFFFLSAPILSRHKLDVYHTSHTWCGLSANLGCRSEMCCMRLTENTGHKKSSKIRHLGTIAQLCRTISSQLRHISTIGKKNLLNSNIFLTCPHSMVNFGPLAAEIVLLIWATPANFNWFRVLAALLHGILVVGIS